MYYKLIQLFILILTFNSTHSYATYPELTAKEYSEWYPLRMNRSTMPEVEHSSFEQLLSEMTFSSSANILSVGAGTGNMEAIWGPKINKRIPLKRFDAIEPNPCHLQPLQAVMNTMSEHIEGLQSKIYETSIEDFWSHKPTERYDMIFLTHVIHWFQDPTQHLQRLQKLLKPHGNIFIVIHSEEGVPRLYHEHSQRVAGDHFGNLNLTAESLSQKLSAHGTNHLIRKFPATLDITEVLNGKPTGLKVLSFLFARNLLKISKKDFSCICNSLKSYVLSDRIDQQEGVKISEPVTWIMIPR
ncbi:MAG: class I SAM-dependent methyltransferase [Oligoflexales bacterium]